MKRIVLGLVTALALLAGPTSVNAAPVEYVRICFAVPEAGWYYVPGTDVCFNPVTNELRPQGPTMPNFGVTIQDRADTLEQRLGFALSGAAIGIVLPNPILPEGQRLAIAGNWGQVGGNHAFGLSTAILVSPHFLVTGAVGVGVGTGAIGTRAGWNLSFGGR